MSVKRTGHGTWQVRWRDANGRNRGKNFKRKVDAELFERETLVDQRRGTWIDPDLGGISVQAWSEQWLTGARNLKPRSRAAYEECLRRILPALGDKRLNRVTDADIDEFLTDLGEEVGPSTVHRHYRTLRRMFRVAVQRGRIPRSPVDPVEEPRIPAEEMRFLTATELETLASTISAPYRTLVLVAGWGGLRWGELAALRGDRVDVARSRVHVVTQLDQSGTVESEPKSRAGRRWVTIPESVMAELAGHIDGRSGLVWTAPAGGSLRHGNFLRRDFYPATVKARLGKLVEDHTRKGGVRYEGVSPHDLRHTAAALAIAQGVHPKSLQMRMGHAKIAVTLDTYGHLMEGMDGDLAERLDETRSTALSEVRRLRAV